MVENFFVQILHKLCIRLCITYVFRHTVKHCRCIDCLSQRPVHSVVDTGISLPVRCIDNPRCSVCIPGILNCPVKQILSSFYIRLCTLNIFPIRGQCPLSNQTRPLDSVPRRCPVWFKRVMGFFYILFQIRFPVFCKMLRNPPAILPGPLDRKSVV